MRKNILITGLPKSGKTTLLRQIIKPYQYKVGFVTNEVRENGERIGFEIENQRGDKAMLASINFKNRYKVGKYCVNISNLNKIISTVLAYNPDDLLYLDEIGQMEIYSDRFKRLTWRYLLSDNICVATLSKVYHHDFVESVKLAAEAIIVEITEANRDQQQKFVGDLIKKIIKAKKYLQEPDRFTVNSNQAVVKSEHGIRHLAKRKSKWSCDCEFHQANQICSHTIALEEFLKK